MIKFTGATNNFRFPEAKETEIMLMPIRTICVFGRKEMEIVKKIETEYITEEKTNEKPNK